MLVGHDMRPTSTPYSEEVIRGITDEGANVVDAGMVSTPLFYHAAMQYDAGCMITASHNPAEYNGFKFVNAQLPVSYGNGIREMESLIMKGMPAASGGEKGRGGVTEHDFLQEFLDSSLSHLKTKKKYAIVVDAGNGMGGYTYTRILPRLAARGITVQPLYFELDGTFPNHEANPLKLETLEELKRAVRETPGVTLGLALDGDGDRCVFIDEKGEHITSDLTLGLVAEQLLKGEKAPVVLDLRCSKAVRELITASGGTPVASPVGYANIKPRAKELNAIFGGEISGHFFPRVTGYNENTLFMLFQILNLIEESGKPLSELVAPLKKYAFSGEINSKVADPDAMLRLLEGKYAAGALEVSHMDGVRIEHAEWWFSARKSNTEPVLRLIVEADTEELMEARRDELLALIRGGG